MNKEKVKYLKEDLNITQLIPFWKVGDTWGFLSQWFNLPITISYPRLFVTPRTFSCAEQFMMFCKAALFNDTEIAEEIMKATTPKRIKDLGRKVKNFDEAKWDEIKRDVVLTASKAKVTSDELKDLMLSKEVYDWVISGGKFVEASPFDAIWGIGLSVDDKDWNDTTKWKGTNYLGEAITEAVKACYEDLHK